MDDVKEAALRAIESAEEKILSHDYVGARNLIYEATKLFPRLEHASEILMVCQILSSSFIELPGYGVDWYWLLNLFPSDEPSTIESQYRELVSLLEPIKDRFQGTELALKSITDAYTVLSDPENRAAFDSKRNKIWGTFVDERGEGSDSGVPRKKIRAQVANLVPDSKMRIENLRKSKWSPKDFAPEQVWAVYDGPDSMPRLYVKVNKVLSLTRICVTLLEANPMMGVEIQWVEESLPIACGVFRASKETANFEISKFSHVVECDRSTKMSFFRIFPHKGEVWALYENWSIDWRHSDIVGYRCYMVEILSDFTEENFMSVRCLFKVKGCLTFFQRQMDDGFQLTRTLQRSEMLRFSHRVPACVVLGIKDRNIPEGSWHLEPDALPPMVVN